MAPVGQFRTALFRQNNKENKWTQETELTQSPCSNRNFGESLAIQGNILVVGQTGDREQGFASGAAFVYTYKNKQWDLLTKLKSPNPKKEESFGDSVALNNNTVLVGAWALSGFSIAQSGLKAFNQFGGSAYIFNLGNQLTQQ